ncbi:hypothetical protein EDD29_0032 [Actinocorallia herbida]|uniref:Uncharacterized protein n=1 Tax=Actinocorallia herbida TaxID=58109 RepID=A0A3N1CML6_9ACTN|nr:hypothetical protein [Actinocorallia herbida]ROO82552.1 hypothetical protein EDD29_0032 [Actinocorallia herbida]
MLSDPNAIPPADRIMSAWIAGVAARWAPHTCPEDDALKAAIAELHEVATDRTETLRTDLLGKAAGLNRGHAQYRLEAGGVEMGHAARADLLMKAGGDPAVAELWMEEGRRRARPVMPPQH